MSGLALPESHSMKAARMLARVELKAEQLNLSGLDTGDHERLKSRLAFAWCGIPEDRRKATTVTLWRINAARSAYHNVQDFNNDLLLPVILAVTPTECATPAFKQALQVMREDQQYAAFRLALGADAEEALSTMAQEAGFVHCARYADLTRALFPREVTNTYGSPCSSDSDSRRLIESMYSSVPIADLPGFLGSLIPGVMNSDRLIGEKLSGSYTSECATVLVPLNDKDCVCHFVVDRETAMSSIMRFGLSTYSLT